MPKKHYLPKGDKEREVWESNFAEQFELVALALGFTAAEIAAVKNDAAAYSYIIKEEERFKTELQERTSYKDQLADGAIGSHLGAFPVLPVLPAPPAVVPAGIFKRQAMTVQRIKNHPDYSESIGKNLGIIGAEVDIDYDKVQPKITLRKASPTGIVLDFVKGQMDGVIVFSGIEPKQTATPPADTAPADTTASTAMVWTEIARVNHSPFVDSTLNKIIGTPETRHYKMQYLKKDIQVGNESVILRVVAEVYRAGNETATKLK